MSSVKYERFTQFKDVGEFVFAGVLTVCGVLGYYLVQKQLSLMRQQTAVMADQLKDARRSAASASSTVERQLELGASQTNSLRDLAEGYRQQLTTSLAQTKSLQRQVALSEREAATLRSQAESLKSQAESLRREVDAANKVAETMESLANANRKAADAATASATAAERIAESSVKQFELTDRPWIHVAIAAGGTLEFLAFADFGDLVRQPRRGPFNYGSRTYVGVPLRFTLTNEGRSVANEIRLTSRLIFISPQTLTGSEPLDVEATKTCDSEDRILLGKQEIFPGENALVHDSPLAQISFDNVTPRSPYRVGESVELVLIGCVAYTFRSGPAVHRTWFAYRVGRRTSKKREPFETWALEIGTNVPSSRIFFQKWAFGGNGAD